MLVTPDDISHLLEALNGRRWAQEEPLLRQRHYFTLFTLPPPKSAKRWMKIRSGDWWKTVALLEFFRLRTEAKLSGDGANLPRSCEGWRRGFYGCSWSCSQTYQSLYHLCHKLSCTDLVAGQNQALSRFNLAPQKHSKDVSAHVVLRHVEEACGRSDLGAKWRGSVWITRRCMAGHVCLSSVSCMERSLANLFWLSCVFILIGFLIYL